ncbi:MULTISPECIES: HypC/HybG/HupF family hydrogenase formation chaperone [unclassified Francisella]|uniref:HypC/HybG/HupF family hydrogenase formation chaperone n=1 Tax=unclassified Francisella TaxID=2610885 RepID=UPI002E33EFEE|nr:MULTISPECIES: HypC/HybG/HupF family hydrogenase formation chaperone [unclassified Francisella]MED7819387.1 HypC/HybG/HupF family hydrogenase formation chaperone [Francisella sp. 19S2-4]MED7830156.1 HypC/HybG/HupF family hydrogenase formation chaperone [Francisella sp. 19S2-10]
MCLAIPAEIVEIKPENQATVNVGGVKKEISLALLADSVEIGDFVIIHVGFALSKLDKEMAQQTLKDLEEMLQYK